MANATLYFQCSICRITTIGYKLSSLQPNQMNITSNNSRHTIEAQRTPLNVLGNGNTVLISNSTLTITVNGNQNRFKVKNSRITITCNGNMNQLQANNSTLNYGFNGNNNNIDADSSSQYHLTFCNGLGNTYPLPNNPNSRNNNQQPQYNYNQRQQNTFYPQNNNQYSPYNPNFYQQNPNQNFGFSWGFGNPGFFGRGGFFDNMGQNINDLNVFFGGRPRRNYSFRPNGGRQFGFDQSQGQEASGLTGQELSVLPKSKHEGKEGHCTVCLCEVQQGEEETFLMCFHSFHWECIRDWLKKSAKCPVCQFDVKGHLRGE